MTILKDRAVIYTRFSSTMQKKTSTEGQIMQSQKVIERNKWRVIEILSDEAKSGQKERKREAYQRLLAMARNKEFDYVVVEMPNRLSRRASTITRLWEFFDNREIKIVDCQRGVPLTETDISIVALYNSIFRPQLADFVRRGHEVAIKNGKWPGALPYGYRRIDGLKASIEIDPVKREIVIRIYREYAAGVSTRVIAANLNRDGIPAPAGGEWNFQTLTGGRHGRGIIGNPIYTGLMLWNTHTTFINDDEMDQKRKNPEEKHVTHKRDDLRIISPELWEATQLVRQGRAVKMFGASGKPKRRAVIPRNNEHPLAGALCCAVCGGHMRIAQSSRNGAPRAACANAHQRSTCDHTRSFDMDVLLEDVASAIEERLTSPKLVKAAYEAWKEERKHDRKKEDERAKLERAVRSLTTEIERLSHALANSRRKPDELLKLIDEKDAERDNITERLKQLGAITASNVIPFDHPNFAQDYCRDVSRLVAALRTNPKAIETRIAFRNLVGAVMVKPSQKRMPYKIDTKINSATFGMRLFSENRKKPQEIAASAWYDNVNPANSVLTLSQHNNTLISLGEWQRAA